MPQLDELEPMLEQLCFIVEMNKQGEAKRKEAAVNALALLPDAVDQMRAHLAQRDKLIEAKNNLIAGLDVKLRDARRRETTKGMIEPSEEAQLRRLLKRHNLVHTLRTFEEESLLL